MTKGGFAAVLLATTAMPMAAFAQQAAPAATPEETASPEIVVTAQKRAENLQDVPIAVTAFSAETLENKTVDDSVDLSFSVPNLTVSDNGSASLRGVGQLAISSSAESGLGYHVNGAYLGAPATETEYYDVERIEVLRGPQGTLYGRNSTAGVINIITQKPTDAFEGYLTAGYGNYSSYKLRGALNVPLGETVAARVAGFFLDRKGYTRNLFIGGRIDGRHMYGLRGSLRFENADTTVTLVGSYFEEDDDKSNTTKGVCTKDRVTGCSALTAGFETPDTRTTIFNTLGLLTGTLLGSFAAPVDYFANAVNPRDLRTVNQDVDPRYFVREWNASLEVAHSFGGVTLTSLTGYQNIRRDILNDFDRFAPAPGVTLLRPITFDAFANGRPITTTQIVSARRDESKAEQWFQEVRLASDFDGAFNFLVGGNYYRFDSSIFVSITHPTLAARQQQRGFGPAFEAFTIESNPSDTRSYGIFGEVYFDLTDRTRLTGGIRYSHDRKSIATRQVFLDPLPDGSLRPYTTGRESWGVVTGRTVLDHEFSDQLNAYVALSRGYKAGGLNPGGPADGQSFDPEYLNAGEIGLKGRTADGTFSANVAAFYYDYSGLQIGQVGQTSAITVNTDARVMGAEAEFVIRPTRRFQVDASVSWLDTKLKNFQSGDEGDPDAIAPGSVIVRDAAGNPVRVSGGTILKDLDGNELPFSPNVKIAVGVQYQIPLGTMTLTPRVDHYQQGPYFGTAFNKPSERFDGYSQTDIKLLLTPEDGPWELRGYVKNLFDNADITRITQEGPLVGRFRSLVLLEPRTYGLEATFRF